MVTELAEPDLQQRQILKLLDGIRLFSAVLLPAGGLGIAGILFYLHHHVAAALPIHSPDAFVDALPVKHLPRMQGQQLQDIKLPPGKRHRLPVYGYGTGCIIYGEGSIL